MQRHKKYLIVTIWISTIAFIGAGFVGWGQYSYGDKSGAIAKVGDIEISQGELQKSYSNLYSKYNEMFQGNFDEEKAKQFGLQKQALQQLTQQALLLNLAASYDLQISDDELLAELKTQEYFFDNGVFNKEIYKQALSRNNLTMKEYETDLKKNLLIQKTLKLLPVKATDSESNVLNEIMNIADKINYKVLNKNDVKVDMSEALVKTFWESKKFDFMNEVSYEIDFIKQDKISNTYKESEIAEYYENNKNHFKDDQGKLIFLENAKDSIIQELNMDATKNAALKTYIAYKKNKLDSTTNVKSQTVSASDNPYNAQIIENISQLSITSPFLKPVLVDNEYFIIQLKKINEAKAKSYEEAKTQVLPMYVEDAKQSKLLALANTSVSTFKGKDTDFITTSSIDKFNELTKEESKDFLEKLFLSNKKNSYTALNSGKIVLYNILEQKMLNKTNDNQSENIVNLKNNIFSEALIKELQNKYQTEIFVKGL